MRTLKLELYIKGSNDTGKQFPITLDLDVPSGWDMYSEIEQEDWLYYKIIDNLSIVDFETRGDVDES